MNQPRLPYGTVRRYASVGMLCFGMSAQQLKKLGWTVHPDYSQMRREWATLNPYLKREMMLEVWIFLFRHPFFKPFALKKLRAIFVYVGRQAVYEALVAQGTMTAHEIFDVLSPGAHP